jgi:chromosomal replication initiator protein
MRLLVLWSEHGLGKTHLLHAIAHAAREQDLSAALMTAEAFVRGYGNAVRAGCPQSFAAAFADLDILLVDDLQFLAGKKGSQEQFFHVFNDLQAANCRVAVTLDSSPNEVAGLSPRLISRLCGGMVAQIGRPDDSARLTILQTKDPALPESALRAIAAYPARHVRELEGALHRVQAYIDLTGMDPTSRVVGDALHPFQPTAAAPDHRAVLEAICERFSLSTEDLAGPSRARDITYARHLAMYFLHNRVRLPYAEIGAILGGRDHTTALSACRRIKRESAVLDSTKADIEALEGAIAGSAA